MSAQSLAMRARLAAIAADRIEELTFLASQGVTLEEAAVQFHVAVKSLTNYLHNHNAGDVIELLRKNGRK